MISINGQILENLRTTAQWAATTTILPNRVWGHEVDNLTDRNPVGSKMGDGINLWEDLPYWNAIGYSAIEIDLNTSDPSLYTLSPSELATVNLITRWPNFVAVVTASGAQFFDIYPIYTGTPGSFTEIKIVLHDGGGTNAEDTVVQFS